MYFPNLNNLMSLNQSMGSMNVGMQLPGLPGQMSSQNGMGVVDRGTALKKVFIKDIHEEVPDSLVRDILKVRLFINFQRQYFINHYQGLIDRVYSQECGSIVQWKRAKNEKDHPMSFGSVEFESIEGVLRSLRILNNMNIGGKQLQLKATEKTDIFIKEWTQLKQKEWDQKEVKNYNSFEEFLAADDQKIKERIRYMVQKMDLSKIRQEKEKELEKKEHPRERERIQKKKQIVKDLERKYKDKLTYWIKREDDKERYQKKQVQKEKEVQKEKQKLLEKELEYDSDDEQKRRIKYPQKYEERMKMRKLEREEDENEYRKEQKIDLPPEPENIMPPLEDEEKEEKETKLAAAKLAAQQLEKQINEKKSKFSYTQQNNISQQQQFKLGPSFINIELQKTNQQKPTDSFFKVEEEQIIQVPIKEPNQQQQQYLEQQQQELLKEEQEKKINQQLQKEKIKEKVLQSKQELEKLVKQIPSNKKELFGFKLDWEAFDSNTILEKKIRPWLVKQSIQILGAEEEDFINIILIKLKQRTTGYEMMDKFQEVLAEDTKDFMKKLWRMLIFEQLKISLNTKLQQQQKQIMQE